MKPTLNIYDASQTRDLSKLAPAKGGTMSADIELLPRAFCGGKAKIYSAGEHAAAAVNCQSCDAYGPSVIGRAAAIAAWNRRATPSPAPIQQPFAWIIVRDSTGEHDGGEPMTDKAEADDYMEKRCLPGWHLEALYRIAPTVKASQ